MHKFIFSLNLLDRRVIFINHISINELCSFSYSIYVQNHAFDHHHFLVFFRNWVILNFCFFLLPTSSGLCGYTIRESLHSDRLGSLSEWMLYQNHFQLATFYSLCLRISFDADFLILLRCYIAFIGRHEILNLFSFCSWNYYLCMLSPMN